VLLWPVRATAVLGSRTVSAAHIGVAGGDWDSALHAWGGHFLQSVAWQRVQAALGQRVMHARGEHWAWAGPLRAGRFPRYLYVPYGPTADGHLDAALESVLTAARSHSLHFIRVEPLGGANVAAALRRVDAVPAAAVQPRWTSILDLTQPEEALRQALSAGHRGSINAAPRKGIAVRHSDDPSSVGVLTSLQRSARAAGGFVDHSPRYHEVEARVLMPLGAARVYVAEAQGAPVAAAMCFDWQDTRYYAHAASDPGLGRKLGAAAPLVWQMILDARASGFHSFDFWGVAPNAAGDHPWAGFTRFKMAFGGTLVERAGTWEVPVRRFRHRLYRSLVRRR
jgi:FemAB family